MIRSSGTDSNGVDGSSSNFGTGANTGLATGSSTTASSTTTTAGTTGPGKYKRNVLEQIRNSLKPFANASDRASSQLQQQQANATIINSQPYSLVTSNHAGFSSANNTQLPQNFLYQHYNTNNNHNNTNSHNQVLQLSSSSVNYNSYAQQSPTLNNKSTNNNHQLFTNNNNNNIIGNSQNNANNTKIFMSNINCDPSSGANNNNGNITTTATSINSNNNNNNSNNNNNNNNNNNININNNIDPSSLLNDVNYQKHIIKRMLESGCPETLINIIKDQLKTSTTNISGSNSLEAVPLVESNNVTSSHLVSNLSLSQQQQQQLNKPLNHPIIIDQRMQQQFVLHKLLKKPSVPSFTSLESESGLYSGAASEKSALSSTSSVRSDSPIVNGNSCHVSILNLQRDRLLPDQPRIVNSSGVPIKEEHNRYHQIPSPYQHQVSLDSIGYLSGSSSSLCPQSQSNLYNVLSHSSSSVASSSSSSSAQYHRLQAQQQQLNGSRNKQSVTNGIVSNSPNNMVSAATVCHRVLSPTSSLSDNNAPSNETSSVIGSSSATTANVNSFRPTDPLPPPPLPPHRSVNVVPPPPPPPSHLSSDQQQGSSRSSFAKSGNGGPNESLSQIKNYIKNQMAIAASNSSCQNVSVISTSSLGTSTSSSSYVSCRPNAFSYASSASSSSPQRGTSPISFNSRFSAAPVTVLNSIIGSTASGSGDSGGIAPTSGLVSQVTQKLHNLNLNSPQATLNTGSTNSLLSTYSGQSFANSPPPSYAASSSSGRQSPTPTISSSSDYASIPVLPLQRLSNQSGTTNQQQQQQQQNQCQTSINSSTSSLQNLHRKLSPISSTSSISLNSQSSSSSNITPRRINSSNVPKHSLQAWSARQAISQSPIIMQSVKSQQVQKPILQTAVAPTLPPINMKPSTNTGTITSTTCLKAAPTGIATQPKAPHTSSDASHATPTYTASSSSISPALSSISKSPSSGKNPPPYPSGLKKNKAMPSASASPSCKPSSSSSGKGSDNYHAAPPPPYSSAVQQNQNRMNMTLSFSNSKLMLSTQSLDSQTQSSDMSGKSPTPPPPPPPPPYSVSLSASQNDSIAQIISGLTSPSSYNGNSGPSTSCNQPSQIQVPTTDPPSYASSMAALAAQRVIVISPNTPYNNNNNENVFAVPLSSTMATTTNSAFVQSSMINNNSDPTAAINSSINNNPLFVSHNSNCDLVNTVESICTSQISALQSGVTSRRLVISESTPGPPLPPKPSSNNNHNNMAPPPPPHFPSHLQQLHQQLTDVASVTSSGGSATNDYELETYSTESSSAPYQTYQTSSASTPSSRENSASSTATSVLNLATHQIATAIKSSNDDRNIHCESCQPNSVCELCKTYDDETSDPDGSRDVFEESEDGTKKRTHQSPIPTRKSLSKAKEKERREFKVRNYSPAAFKFYMEQHVENVIKSQQQREKRREQLESEMKKACLSEEDQLGLRQMLYQKESNYIRLRRAKMDRSMFKKIKTIGVGAFGEVALVRKIDANLLYAMKTLRKDDVLKRNQVAHVKAERDILAEADCEWVVKLYYSFQDEEHLYFVMDYIPGGDLMSLLIKKGIFEEPLARFYIAELVLAVESVHKMGFIHRDIKPDNVLIDKDGHIKLTDFGLCTGFRWTHNSKYYHERGDSMDFDEARNMSSYDCNCKLTKPLERRKRREHQRCLAHSLVGTPNYIAPEVLMRNGYTQLCDWWSVGVILFEMVVGRPPFFANTPEDTQLKVINWKEHLQIPNVVMNKRLSDEVIKLIQKLCCDAVERLGRNGAEEIKRHPFFRQINFNENLREQKAPYIPEIKFDTDTSNFDPVSPDHLHSDENDDFMLNCYNEFGEKAINIERNKNKNKSERSANHPEHAFFEFTFRRFFDAIEPFKLTNDNSNSSTNVSNHSTFNGGIYGTTIDSTLSETASLISNSDYEDVLITDNSTLVSTTDPSHASSLSIKNLANNNGNKINKTNNGNNPKVTNSNNSNSNNSNSDTNTAITVTSEDESRVAEDEQGNNAVFV